MDIIRLAVFLIPLVFCAECSVSIIEKEKRPFIGNNFTLTCRSTEKFDTRWEFDGKTQAECYVAAKQCDTLSQDKYTAVMDNSGYEYNLTIQNVSLLFCLSYTCANVNGSDSMTLKIAHIDTSDSAFFVWSTEFGFLITTKCHSPGIVSHATLRLTDEQGTSYQPLNITTTERECNKTCSDEHWVTSAIQHIFHKSGDNILYTNTIRPIVTIYFSDVAKDRQKEFVLHHTYAINGGLSTLCCRKWDLIVVIQLFMMTM